MTPASASHHTGNEFATLSTKLCPCPQQPAMETPMLGANRGESPSCTPTARNLHPQPHRAQPRRRETPRAPSPRKQHPQGALHPHPHPIQGSEEDAEAVGSLRLTLLPGEPAGMVLEIDYLLLALDPHVLHPLLYVLAFVGAALLALLQPGCRVHHLHGWDGNATALSGQRIWGKEMLRPTSGSPHRRRWQLGIASAGRWMRGAVPSPRGTTVAIPARMAHGGKPGDTGSTCQRSPHIRQRFGELRNQAGLTDSHRCNAKRELGADTANTGRPRAEGEHPRRGRGARPRERKRGDGRQKQIPGGNGGSGNTEVFIN